MKDLCNAFHMSLSITICRNFKQVRVFHEHAFYTLSTHVCVRVGRITARVFLAGVSVPCAILLDILRGRLHCDVYLSSVMKS